MDPLFISFLVAGYLIGAIPFGLLLTRLAGLGDIRAIGSGNIGATNVLRTGRKDLALLTLLLDAGKGGIVVLVGIFALGLSDQHAAMGGAAAFLGHCFPVYLRFKGGKGVATFFGTLFGINWLIGLIAGADWLIMAALFRISSLAGLTAAVSAPLAAWILGYAALAPVIAFMSVLIIYRHSENIKRLIKGQEPRMGGKKEDTSIT